jgi:hypothetical protein
MLLTRSLRAQGSCPRRRTQLQGPTCGCRIPYVTASLGLYLLFLSTYDGGGERTRLRRDVGIPSLTSHQELRKAPCKMPHRADSCPKSCERKNVFKTVWLKPPFFKIRTRAMGIWLTPFRIWDVYHGPRLLNVDARPKGIIDRISKLEVRNS